MVVVGCVGGWDDRGGRGCYRADAQAVAAPRDALEAHVSRAEAMQTALALDALRILRMDALRKRMEETAQRAAAAFIGDLNTRDLQARVIAHVRGAIAAEFGADLSVASSSELCTTRLSWPSSTRWTPLRTPSRGGR